VTIVGLSMAKTRKEERRRKRKEGLKEEKEGKRRNDDKRMFLRVFSFFIFIFQIPRLARQYKREEISFF